MENKTRILIVEDDMLIAANISLQLSNLGYQVTGIESRGELAIAHVENDPPDLILMDVNLKGQLDGIDTARSIRQKQNIPIVYLTANNDEVTFAKAKETHPHAFISKPFNKLNLQRTIALVVERLKERSKENLRTNTDLKVLEDRIFVRHSGRMVKILLDQILYIEAERNYCNIVSLEGRYLVVSTLKSIEKELPATTFLRVHRSYIVNILKLDVVADSHIEINRKVIPVSKTYRDNLLGRLHTI